MPTHRSFVGVPPLGTLALLTALAALSCSHDPPPAKLPSGDSTIQACTAQRWLNIPPQSTDESIFGAGLGATAEEAAQRAKGQAAGTIETTISGTIDDTQRLIQRSGDGGGRESHEETQFTDATRATVEQRLRECRTRDICRDTNDNVHALIECSRKSALERELARAASRVSEEAPHDGSILVVPGVEAPNRVTRLAEYARTTVSDLIPSGGDHAQIIPASSWQPRSIETAAKEAHAKYVLRVEYRQAGQHRYRFSVYIQDPSSKARIGTASSFDADLEPWQLALVSPLGSLEPEETVTCTPRFSSGINKTNLSEGDTVEFTYALCEDSYVYLYDVYEDGQIVLMFPNSMETKGPVPAMGKHTFPGEGWKKAGLPPIVACPLPGKASTRESYRMIFSPTALDLPGTAHLDPFLHNTTSGTLRDLDEQLSELIRRRAPVTQQDIPFVINAVTGSKSGCPK